MPTITVAAEGTQERFSVDAAILTLGRGLECEIQLKDIRASRRHAQIVKLNDGYKVVDLGSGNGTFLNGVQVREERLKPGDKIQIGTTVIMLDVAARNAATAVTAKAAPGPGATKTRPGTQAVTKAVAPPVTGTVPKTGTQKLATGATSRRATTVPAKSATKTGTGRNTGAISKPTAATQLSRATTGRVTGRITSRRTAVERFQQSATQKKANPLVLIGGGVGAALVLVIAIFMFAGGGSGGEGKIAFQKAEAVKFIKMGRDLEESKNFDSAIAEYEKALAVFQKFPENFRADTAAVQEDIKAARESSVLVDRLNKEWFAFKVDYEKPGSAATRETCGALLARGRQLAVPAKEQNMSWLGELKITMEKLENVMASLKAAESRGDFQSLWNELNDTCKLGRPAEALYGKALAELKKFLTSTADAATKPKVETRIGMLTDEASKVSRGAIRRAKDAEDREQARKILEAAWTQVDGEGGAPEQNLKAELEKYR